MCFFVPWVYYVYSWVAPAPAIQAPPPPQYVPPVQTAPPVQCTPDPQQSTQLIQWIPCTGETVDAVTDRAIVAGYEGQNDNPLWVIRANHQGDVVPGCLSIKHKTAYVPWGGSEIRMFNFEVCVGASDRVRWVKCHDGNVPPNAVRGGYTNTGEILYIGRAHQGNSLTPGKVHPSHRVMYTSYAGREIAHTSYEVMCLCCLNS